MKLAISLGFILKDDLGFKLVLVAWCLMLVLDISELRTLFFVSSRNLMIGLIVSH